MADPRKTEDGFRSRLTRGADRYGAASGKKETRKASDSYVEDSVAIGRGERTAAKIKQDEEDTRTSLRTKGINQNSSGTRNRFTREMDKVGAEETVDGKRKALKGAKDAMDASERATEEVYGTRSEKRYGKSGADGKRD